MKNLLKNFILIFVVAFLGFFINACSEDFIASLLRLLSGLVTSPGNQSISGVNVILTDSKGDFIDTIAVTKTNSDGTYTFNNPPPGPKRLFFEKGSFRDTVDVVIPETGNQTAGTAVVTTSKKLAYFFGDRDSIQTFVSSFGYSLDRLNINQLSDTSVLNKYDIIFINSGNDSRFNIDNAGPKLKQYMDSGGSIYASDWAMGGLSRIPGLGLNEFSDGCYGGLGDTIYSSSVTDVNLSSFLNKSNVTVKYKLNEWFSLDSNVTAGSPFAKSRYGDGCNNFIPNNRPLSLNINVGSKGGKLIYTTFRNESGQTPDGLNILKFYLFEL